ncbi:MAG: DUF58 domain-containing protein [Oscillospiraceae bacterium]|nr:DUF58 domain-containing protein [Oscillospiraceae bacterium]
MREFRVFYGVLTFLVTAMCFVYQSRLMPLLLLILTICPAISFIIMLISYFSIRLKAMPSEIIANKFESFDLELNLRNRFIFPVSPIRIIGDFQDFRELQSDVRDAGGENLGGEKEVDFSKKILMTDLPPFSSSSIKATFSLPFRGEYVIRIYELWVYDVMKLFRLRKKFDIQIRTVILPREKLPNDSGKETETESESPASRITAHRSNMFSSLREYREGDSIRHIHWKLSAKQDEIIIKQQEQSVNNSAVIFSDFSCNFGEEKENVFMNRRMNDAVLETALAITKRILQDGNSVINCWQDVKNSEKYEATEFNHYGYLFNAFTAIPQVPMEKPFGDLIELFSPEIKEHHTIYIITPIINDTLLKALEDSGLAMRGGVSLVTFATLKPMGQIIDFINEKTKLNLIEIDDEAVTFDV